MKSLNEIRLEMQALRALAARHPAAQASIAGQIEALKWVANFPKTLDGP